MLSFTRLIPTIVASVSFSLNDDNSGSFLFVFAFRLCAVFHMMAMSLAFCPSFSTQILAARHSQLRI